MTVCSPPAQAVSPWVAADAPTGSILGSYATPEAAVEDIHLGSEANAKILFFAGFYSLNALSWRTGILMGSIRKETSDAFPAVIVLLGTLAPPCWIFLH